MQKIKWELIQAVQSKQNELEKKINRTVTKEVYWPEQA